MTGNARAASLMVLAMACFAGEDALLKLLTRDVPIGQILAFVGLSGMMLFGTWVGFREGLRWRDLLHPGVVIRNICEGICAVCFVTALATGDLSIASAILQALPLLMTLGAALFLGEPVGWRRWLSIAMGFLGVLLIVRPGSAAFELGSLLALIATLALAVRDLATRALPASISTGIVTVSAFGAMGFAGVALIFGAGQSVVAVSSMQMAGMLGCLILGLAGYITMVIATRVGEISAIAPFRYSRLIFAIILGITVFGERPDLWTLSGAGLIALAGCYTMWREARLRRAKLATM